MKNSVLAGIAAAACWGFSNVLSKFLLSHFAPLFLLAIQLISSNVLLWTMIAYQKKATLSRANTIKYSLPGLLQPGLAFSFSVFGLNLTSANNEALIWVIESIVIIFLASFLLREHIGWRLLFLATCGSAGTFLATTSNFDIHFDMPILIGNALILAGVVCAAFYSIYSQGQLDDIDPLYLIALHQLSGLVLVIGVWLISIPVLGLTNRWSNFDFLLALVSGVTAYALPFFLYLISIRGIGAAKASIILALPPIFTIFGSYLFLGERLEGLQWVGVLLSLAAVSGICLVKNTENNHPVAL